MASDLERRIRYCDRITKASGSNLWMVSRALPAVKHRFFTVAYASMRVIDDFVDDEFMGLDVRAREAGRDAAEAKVRLWSNSPRRRRGEALWPVSAATRRRFFWR
ncbi:MAG: hypothetical protein P8J87_08945 [Verrucomicrobiales bacterium]|nr:hypothetical protein [Verrucomicrobiales bacterium]